MYKCDIRGLCVLIYACSLSFITTVFPCYCLLISETPLRNILSERSSGIMAADVSQLQSLSELVKCDDYLYGKESVKSLHGADK